MKNIYYLKGKDRIGPLTIEQFTSENINKDTLVWFDGLSNWEKLSDIDELKDLIVVPPPAPIENVLNNDLINSQLFMPSKSQLGFFIVWLIIFWGIFLLTKTENDFIQNGFPDTEKIWPFSAEFYSHKISDNPPQYGCTQWGEPCFYGIFADYDISETIIYSIIPLIIFLLRRLFRKKMPAANTL